MRNVVLLVVLLLAFVPVPAQTILFNGNMESGTLQGYRPEGNDSSALGTTISTAYARSGTYSMKSYLHRTLSPVEYRTMVYCEEQDDDPWNSGTTFRYTYGTVYWIAVSIYIPSDWVLDDTEVENMLWQLKGSPDAGEENTNPPLCLQIVGDEYQVIARWSNDVPTVKYVWDEVAVVYEGGSVSADRGTWVDWLWHVRPTWDEGQGGFVATYRNGTLLDSTYMPVGVRDDLGPYQTFGIYAWNWADESYPPSGYNPQTDNRTYYFDEYKIGDAANTPTTMAPGEPAYGGKYYVAKTGSDSNPGTLALPWLTIAHAISSIEGGDTIVVKQGLYSGEAIHQLPAGTEESWTCIMTEGTDTVGIYNSPYAGVYLNGAFVYGQRKYISINGHFNVRSSGYYGLKLINNCDRIFIRNVRFYAPDVGSYPLNKVQGDTTNETAAIYPIQWLWIDSCFFEYKDNAVGTTLDLFAAWQVDSLLVSNCEFTKYTHYVQFVHVKHFILKNNNVHNAHGGLAVRGTSLYGVVEGNRTYHTKNDSATTWAQGQKGGSGQMSGGEYIAFRGNMFYDDTVSYTSSMQALTATVLIDLEFADDVRQWVWYNNTFYGAYDDQRPGMGITADIAWALYRESEESGEAGYADLDSVRYLSNIFYRTRHGSYDGPHNLIYLTNYEVLSPSSFTHWFNGNGLWDDTLQAYLIYYGYSGGSVAGSLTWAETYYPTRWGPANVFAAPEFEDTTIQGYYRDFSLAVGSPYIDAGVPIDTLASSVAGYYLTFKHNAACVTDGFGMVNGDSIRVGAAVTKVTSVNYATKVVGVSTAVFASADTPIWYWKNGQIWNDIGAVQYTEEAPAIPTMRRLRGFRR